MWWLQGIICNPSTHEVDLGGFYALVHPVCFLPVGFLTCLLQNKLKPTCDLQAGATLRHYQVLEAQEMRKSNHLSGTVH